MPTKVTEQDLQQRKAEAERARLDAITVSRFQAKAARTMGVLDAMEQPITLDDGQSVTFPDYLKEVADDACKGN